jgi:hypothetical protein
VVHFVTEPLADLRSRTVQAFDATGATTWATTLEGSIPHDGTSGWMVAHDGRVVVTLNGEERFGLDVPPERRCGAAAPIMRGARLRPRRCSRPSSSRCGTTRLPASST